jgi:RIO-like serine/threonine protein kinase
VLPTQLAAGAWDITRYQAFLGGKFPSTLRRHETGVNVIVLSYIDSFDAFSHTESSEARLKGVKAALRSLRALHEIGILHGDISAENTLVQRRGDVYAATWIDFSSSIVKPSPARVASEWRDAIDYFSILVCGFCSVLMN